MKRDMDLCRSILFEIEEKYVDVALFNLQIPEFTMEQVAYHCKILHDAGLISEYNAQYGCDHIYFFVVGSLTWEGHEFLDKIRQDTIWHKTKNVITKQGLPMAIDVVKQVAQSIITSMTEGAVKAIINQ